MPAAKPTTKKTPVPKRGRGQPPLLNADVAKVYFEAVAMGMSRNRAAGWAGVSEAAVKNWLARGEVAKQLPAGKRSAHDKNCVEFLQQHTRVDNEWIHRCETVLRLAMIVSEDPALWELIPIEDKRLAVETAKFKLTHRAASEYSTSAQLQVTGADGGPLDVNVANGQDVFRILLEAEARERADEA